MCDEMDPADGGLPCAPNAGAGVVADVVAVDDDVCIVDVLV